MEDWKYDKIDLIWIIPYFIGEVTVFGLFPIYFVKGLDFSQGLFIFNNMVAISLSIILLSKLKLNSLNCIKHIGRKLKRQIKK